MKKILCLLIGILIISACAKPEKNANNDISYQYFGNFISLVDQRNEPINKEMNIEFTLQMENFNPTEKVFDKYNSQFEPANDQYKHIEITSRTKVYQLHHNERQVVPVTNIEDSTQLEVWIKPHELSDYHIEALEIYIVD